MGIYLLIDYRNMNDLKKKTETRLWSATAGFTITTFFAVVVGYLVNSNAIIIAGVVAFALAGLSTACVIALQAFSDEELHKILKR